MKPSQLTLADGGRVRVRQLRPSDRRMYEEAVAGLSPRSRYLRFSAPIPPKMSESLLDQMMRFDDARHVAYAALTPEERTIVGVVRFVRTGESRSAEVAIAVADDWQGRGLGRALLGRVVEHARAAGLDCLIATTLNENRIAARLAHAAGFATSSRDGIYTAFAMRLGTGTPRRAPRTDASHVGCVR